MRKKILSLALALAMCLGLMAVPAAAVNPGEEWVGDFVVNGDTLVGYYGDGGAITIPSGVKYQYNQRDHPRRSYQHSTWRVPKLHKFDQRDHALQYHRNWRVGVRRMYQSDWRDHPQRRH